MVLHVYAYYVYHAHGRRINKCATNGTFQTVHFGISQHNYLPKRRIFRRAAIEGPQAKATAATIIEHTSYNSSQMQATEVTWRVDVEEPRRLARQLCSHRTQYGIPTVLLLISVPFVVPVHVYVLEYTCTRFSS
jgi:hypothetical protein